MKNDTFKRSSIGVTALTVIFIVLAIVGVISTWAIAVAVAWGVTATGAMLYYLGKEYTGCY